MQNNVNISETPSLNWARLLEFALIRLKERYRVSLAYEVVTQHLYEATDEASRQLAYDVVDGVEVPVMGRIRVANSPKLSYSHIAKCVPGKHGCKSEVDIRQSRSRLYNTESKYRSEYLECKNCKSPNEVRDIAHEAYLMLTPEQTQQIPEAVDILAAIGVLDIATDKPAWLPAVSDIQTKAVYCHKGTTEIWLDGVLIWPHAVDEV